MKCAKVRIKEEFRTEWCPEWWSSGSRNLWTSKGKALQALKYGNKYKLDEYEIVEFYMIPVSMITTKPERPKTVLLGDDPGIHLHFRSSHFKKHVPVD